MDQLIRHIRRRLEPIAAGLVLLGHRCKGLSQVGVLSGCVIGMNSITIWVGQRCIDFTYTAGFLFNGMLQYAGAVKPVLGAFSVLMLKWLFLYFLHRNKIYLKA